MDIKDKMYFTFIFDLDGDFVYKNDYKPYNYTIDNNAVIVLTKSNIFIKPTKHYPDGEYDFTNKKIPISYTKNNNYLFYVRGYKNSPVSFGLSMICERNKRNKFNFENDLDSVKELVKTFFSKDYSEYLTKIDYVMDILKEHESSLNSNKYPINPFPYINKI